MAAAKKRLFSAFKFSRKLALMTGGFLVLLGASGTAALVFSGSVIPSVIDKRNVASRHCSTVYQSKFVRAGEKRLVVIIRADDKKPDHRVETGLRLAKHLADVEHVDLITVQIADRNGPESRAELRGSTIGTEIVHAPNPNRSRATSSKWEVRYIDAEPNDLGNYFGERKSLRSVEIDLTLKSIDEFGECDGDIIETADAGTDGAKDGHGEKPAEEAAVHTEGAH